MSRSRRRQGTLSLILIAMILAVDQCIKIAVKTHMCLGESIEVTPWFLISFIENNGMAYGMTLFNKLALSLFRIILIAFLAWYVARNVGKRHSTAFIVCLSMVIAGAAGNMIDSMLYGLVFEQSTPFAPSAFVPVGDGYAPFLYGKVVDMFYFPIITTTWPDWMPFVGGDDFIFFAPVFNFADACITVGALLIILFHRHELEKMGKGMSFGRKKEKNDATKRAKGATR